MMTHHVHGMGPSGGKLLPRNIKHEIAGEVTVNPKPSICCKLPVHNRAPSHRAADDRSEQSCRPFARRQRVQKSTTKVERREIESLRLTRLDRPTPAVWPARATIRLQSGRRPSRRRHRERQSILRPSQCGDRERRVQCVYNVYKRMYNPYAVHAQHK
ncbi:unnamed protein product [Sphagnum balticum]